MSTTGSNYKMSTAGSINEPGYVNGMNKKGFNGARGLGELTANPIDAKASCITYAIFKDNIYIIDNGCGMNKGQLVNMWDAQRQNHLHEKSTGVSGYGAKPSTKILSQNHTVIVYTKSEKSEYYKAVVPWDIIVLKGKYTDMITICDMDHTEIAYFKEKLKEGTGTIIKFPYNVFLEKEIIKQFYDSKSIKESNQRLDCVFSKFTHITLICHHYEKTEPKKLDMYGYFNGSSLDYYMLNRYDVNVFLDSGNNHI